MGYTNLTLLSFKCQRSNLVILTNVHMQTWKSMSCARQDFPCGQWPIRPSHSSFLKLAALTRVASLSLLTLCSNPISTRGSNKTASGADVFYKVSLYSLICACSYFKFHFVKEVDIIGTHSLIVQTQVWKCMEDFYFFCEVLLFASPALNFGLLGDPLIWSAQGLSRTIWFGWRALVGCLLFFTLDCRSWWPCIFYFFFLFLLWTPGPYFTILFGNEWINPCDFVKNTQSHYNLNHILFFWTHLNYILNA